MAKPKRTPITIAAIAPSDRPPEWCNVEAREPELWLLVGVAVEYVV
jgi:hypothetical protein